MPLRRLAALIDFLDSAERVSIPVAIKHIGDRDADRVSPIANSEIKFSDEFWRSGIYRSLKKGK